MVGFRPRFFANFYLPAGAVPPCKTQPRGVYWGTAAWCRKKCAVPRRRDGSRRKIEYEIRQKRPLPDPAGAADRADAGDGKHLFGLYPGRPADHEPNDRAAGHRRHAVRPRRRGLAGLCVRHDQLFQRRQRHRRPDGLRVPVQPRALLFDVRGRAGAVRPAGGAFVPGVCPAAARPGQAVLRAGRPVRAAFEHTAVHGQHGGVFLQHGLCAGAGGQAGRGQPADVRYPVGGPAGCAGGGDLHRRGGRRHHPAEKVPARLTAAGRGKRGASGFSR